MKVYIQSKTGDYNTIITYDGSLQNCMKNLRRVGGYACISDRRGVTKIVPFEEIQHIEEYHE